MYDFSEEKSWPEFGLANDGNFNMKSCRDRDHTIIICIYCIIIFNYEVKLNIKLYSISYIAIHSVNIGEDSDSSIYISMC